MVFYIKRPARRKPERIASPCGKIKNPGNPPFFGAIQRKAVQGNAIRITASGV